MVTTQSYDLLEASAQQADTSVHHLVDLLAKIESKGSPDLAAFAQSRREDKRITQEMTEQLTKTFITPLEREDIQALAASLYTIPKTVEKKRFSGMRWTVVERIVWGWIFTLPATGLIGYLFERLAG